MKRDLLLWTPILLSPSVWFLSLAANFALAPLACAGSGKTALHLVSLTALIITAGSALLATSLRRRFGSGAAGAPADRVRAMAVAGVVLSAAFFLVIAAQALPDFIFSGCE